MQKLLSIIVPVYKVEPYINKCLDSCLIRKRNESGEMVLDDEMMKRLEVIVVNDGTPDKSAEMSRQYVRRFPETFRQIDKENGGHGSAWNVGLKEATGKYLRFLDSDDWLTGLPEFMDKLSDCDADVVITRMSRYYEDKQVTEDSQCPKTIDTVLPISIIGPEEFQEYYNITNFWFSTYKTSILKPLYPLFVEGVSYDDSILFIVPLMYAKDYMAYDLVLYNYLLGREGQSMTLDIQRKKIPDRIKVLSQMCSFLNEDLLQGGSGALLRKIICSKRDMLMGLIASVRPFRLSSSYNDEFKSFTSISNLTPQSKLYKRYKRYPFWFFYLIERIRDITSKRIK